MTASTALDGGAVGATERAFPCLDGARIVAATAVLLLHVAGATGADASSPLGRALSHLDAGVAVFFVLSGFLLFRPFALAAVRRRRAPGTGAYLWRRALRILPAYWVTVAAALLLLPANEGASGTTWLRHLTLVQIYDEWWFAQGLDHVWSLCVEVSFYVVLPLLASLLVRLSRRQAGRPWPAMAVLCTMAVIGPVYVYASWVWRTSTPSNLWLPAFAGWFAGGMALAILTTADPDWRPVRVARALGANLGRCWTASAALYALACTQLTGPVGLQQPTPGEATIKNVLYMGIAVCFVLPLVMAGPNEGPVRRLLSSRPSRLLGEVSYGVFLMHLLLLRGLYESLGAAPLTGSFWFLAPILWVSSVAAAALLYVTVERPVRRWRSLILDKSETAATA
jgi:peptidoglycan/LPS O-acetylase OafA/YrhL